VGRFPGGQREVNREKLVIHNAVPQLGRLSKKKLQRSVEMMETRVKKKKGKGEGEKGNSLVGLQGEIKDQKKCRLYKKNLKEGKNTGR